MLPDDRTRNQEQSHKSDPAKLDTAIQCLLAPYGNSGNRRDRDRALQYLLDHADDAHPKLLALLEQVDTGTYLTPVVMALPYFGRSESIPVLEKVMQTASEALSLSAGEALAQHPLPTAMNALIRGLTQSHSNKTMIAAADGLMTRGDQSCCPLLLKMIYHPDREVRYHVLQAAGQLNCLSQQQLQSIADNDSEPVIRDLAIQLLPGNC
ncbi:HEAT repeat domain-containing protein [Cyanobacteria bacterium FACHB-63]|nr:HEAT repeat domain-containing protein [Cyanobacteria bacterium FACHB-63]